VDYDEMGGERWHFCRWWKGMRVVIKRTMVSGVQQQRRDHRLAWIEIGVIWRRWVSAERTNIAGTATGLKSMTGRVRLPRTQREPTSVDNFTTCVDVPFPAVFPSQTQPQGMCVHVDNFLLTPSVLVGHYFSAHTECPGRPSSILTEYLR